MDSDRASRNAALATIVRASTLAIEAFPHTILPNPMIKEFRSLAAAAGLSMPLVEELAADIFMGAFTGTFLRAAQEAARLLTGSLYERYYGIPYGAILELDDVGHQNDGAPTSPGFARICEDLAGAHRSGTWSVARNGTIIEQSQILTTHNLAALIASLDLMPALRPELPLLARRCFEWLCRRQQLRLRDWRATLQMLKNTAYAWRQMLFYLSLLEDRAELDSFLDWAIAHLEQQSNGFRERFAPAMGGLRAIAAGAGFDAAGYHPPSGGRRFLGWSVEQHWLLGK